MEKNIPIHHTVITLTETFHLISVGKTKERSTRRPSAQAQDPGQLP
jgi:hypothetical protein